MHSRLVSEKIQEDETFTRQIEDFKVVMSKHSNEMSWIVNENQIMLKTSSPDMEVDKVKPEGTATNVDQNPSF